MSTSGGQSGAPTNSPTFSGTVTMPDASTFASTGAIIVSSFTSSGDTTLAGGVDLTFSDSQSGTNSAVQSNCGFLTAVGTNTTMLLPGPGDESTLSPNDGAILYFVTKGAGTFTITAPYSLDLVGQSGTFTLSITGFTTTPAQTVATLTAAALQTLLSDGTHGPAGTTVFDVQGLGGADLYLITVPGSPATTGNFTGLTPGGISIITNSRIDGQQTITIPGHCGVWIANNGTAYYTVGSLAHCSNTANNATATTPTPVTGTAFTPSANQDCELSFEVATSTTVQVTYGPSTGAEHTIWGSLTRAVGQYFCKTIPAGWKVVITGTIADLQNILAVTK